MLLKLLNLMSPGRYSFLFRPFNLVNTFLSTSLSDWLTPHIVFVRAIQLFDSSVAEGQFPHPVDPAADPRSQAQVGAGCSCMEAISCKTVSTVNNNDMFYLKYHLWWNKKIKWLFCYSVAHCTFIEMQIISTLKMHEIKIPYGYVFYILINYRKKEPNNINT